jgi:hypothetical protein
LRLDTFNRPRQVEKWGFSFSDVIITWDFYQVRVVHDARVFKINANNINSLAPNFWMQFFFYEL